MSAPRIVFSEWLAGGVMVHFAGGPSVFYPAEFLFAQRGAPETKVSELGYPAANGAGPAETES